VLVLHHAIAPEGNIRKGEARKVVFRDSPIAKRLQLRPCLPPKKLIKKLRRLVGLEMAREGASHGVYRTASGNELVIPRERARSAQRHPAKYPTRDRPRNGARRIHAHI